MNIADLNSVVDLGENATRQFKADVRGAKSLASEMVALANSEGGVILIGVAKDGSKPGLDSNGLARVNQIFSDAAINLTHELLDARSENVALEDGRLVTALTVPKGLDKPYLDHNGVIWVKNGAYKRRVTSKEELLPLFLANRQFRADELPTSAGPEMLDARLFHNFLQATYPWPHFNNLGIYQTREAYQAGLPQSKDDLARLLRSLCLATDEGFLNLAGALMFARQPEMIAPQFTVKAVTYFGNQIHDKVVLFKEDIRGTLGRVFEGAMDFIMRNMRKVQAGRGFNYPGTPEIDPDVFVELLVNSLVHRNYLINIPVRLLVFDDRVEIISPGNLPGHLTVANILSGFSHIRNRVIASYVAKGILPYQGLGTGIRRALAKWPDIEFVDDWERRRFTCRIHRQPIPR